MAPDPRQPPARFAVRVTDADGHSYTWPTSVVTPLPGTTWVRKVWGQAVRVPLAAASAAGVDLSRVTALSVLPRSTSGNMWVLDAHGWSPGLAPVTPINLPQLNVQDASVVEGNGGPHTAFVHVSVTGTIHAPATFWVEASDTTNGGRPIDATVTLHPGDTGYDIPIPVSGNTLDNYDDVYQVFLKAISGVSTGNYTANFTVLDDDPSPTLTITSVPAVEGTPLTWTFTLSGPSGIGVSISYRARPPHLQPELSTDDVPLHWLRHCARVPKSPRPLSAARLWCLGVNIDPGQTVGTLQIPTVADGITEGTEYVRLKQTWSSLDPSYPKVVLHGVVTES